MDQLLKLKVSQLRSLCFTTGTSPVGKKTEIADALLANLSYSPFQNRISNSRKNFSVLSIDMGIKNFAFTRLQLDKTTPFNKPPVVKDWIKFDINHWAKTENPAFEPKELSEITYRLVEDVLFNPKEDIPDFILIERQRTRTMGSTNILEWVFRVNMFEAMIHAFSYSKIRNLGITTDLISTNPKKMGDYWKPLNMEALKPKDSKNHRMILVESWLKDILGNKVRNPPFILDKERFNIEELKKVKSKSRSKSINQIILNENAFLDEIYPDRDDANEKQVKDKGDDLVDCMLHGLSWLDWEKNRMFLNLELIHGGIEHMLSYNDKLLKQHHDGIDRILAPVD